MSEESSKWDGLIKASVGDVRRLDNVIRFSSIPVSVPESVSEHSFWVTVYAAMIHRSLCPDVDVLGQILMAALIHDLPEALTGDLVRPFKYSTPELKAEIDRAEALLLERLPPEVLDLTRAFGASAMPGEWGKYVKAVVKAADFLSLFQYLRREASRGNLEVIPFYNRMVDDLSTMADTVGVSKASGDISDSGFPASFYKALRDEACIIRDDCFKEMWKDPRWTRPV